MSDWDMDGGQNHWNAEEDVEDEANVEQDEVEWMQQFAEDHFANDEGDEGDGWIETDTMSSDETYAETSDEEEQAISVDPLVRMLDQPHPNIPPRHTRFPGQPLPHTSVRGAACPLRPGVASFPAASVSQHYQTADALAVIPPPSQPSLPGISSSSTHSAKAQADAHAPVEAVVGDSHRLMVVRIRQGAVSQQLDEHAPRLKAAVQLAYSNQGANVGAGVSTAGAASHSTAQHAAPGKDNAPEPSCSQPAPTGAAAPASAASTHGPHAQANASSEPASTEGGGDDLGFEVLCDAHLGKCGHYSITTSPDGRFVATCGSSGLILLFAYIRGSTAADGPRAKLLQLAVFSTDPDTRNDHHMINCVRFGQFAGEMRLIVTGQDRRVFFFNLPEWPANGNTETVGDVERISIAEKELSLTQAHELLVRDLRPWAELSTPAREPRHHHQRQHRQEPKTQRLEVASQSIFIMQEAGSSVASPRPVQTQGIKGFPKPPNCCEPSPDGRWLVVSVDQPRLFLIPACTEYWRRPSVILKLPSTKSKVVGSFAELGSVPRREQQQQQQQKQPQQQPSPPPPPQQQQPQQQQQQQAHQQQEGRNQQEQKSSRLLEGADEPPGLSRAYEDLFYFDRMLPAACQYCRFSPDARYLAATSDSMQSLFVWSIPDAALEGEQAAASQPAPANQAPYTDQGPSTSEAQPSLPSSGQPQLLFVVRARKPLMALSWCPWDKNQLVAAQDRWRFMMLDVRNPGASLTRITLPRYLRMPQGTHAGESLFAPPKEPRINGLALTPDGKILFATPSILFVAQAITQWDRSLAASGALPPAFYAAARTLLLGAHQMQQNQHQPQHSARPSSSRDEPLGAHQVQQNHHQPQHSARSSSSREESCSQATTSAECSERPQATPTAAGSAHEQPAPETECLLHMLPPDVIELITAKAAFPVWEWGPMIQTLPVNKYSGDGKSHNPFWRRPLMSEDLNDWEEVPTGSQHGEQQQQQQQQQRRQQRQQEQQQLQRQSEQQQGEQQQQQQQHGEPMQVDAQYPSSPMQGEQEQRQGEQQQSEQQEQRQGEQQQHEQQPNERQQRLLQLLQQHYPFSQVPLHVKFPSLVPPPPGQPSCPAPHTLNPRYIPASVLRVVHAQDVLHPRLFSQERGRRVLSHPSDMDDLSDSDFFRESSDFSMTESGSEEGSGSEDFSTAGSEDLEGADFAAGWGDDEPNAP